MMRAKAICVGLLLILSAASCDNNGPTPSKEPTPAGSQQGKQSGPHPGLLNPSLANEQAPASYRARFNTTKGSFVIEVDRSLAPIGADRFYNLVKIGFFSDVAFFRVIKGFMAQFGVNGVPAISAAWSKTNMQDEPRKASNTRGTVSFAKMQMPNTRSTQLFINYADNSRLDPMNFAPIGQVTEGMEIVDALYSGYGSRSTSAQGGIAARGNGWLREKYPKLDFIVSAQIIK